MTPQRAYRITRTAIKSGAIVRQNKCERCGALNKNTKDSRSYIHAHHVDHNKPLNIQWLCAKCHRAETPLPKVMGAPVFGERNGASKLTVKEVLEIRKSGEFNGVLARSHRVHPNTISYIRNGKTWAWLAACEEEKP